MNEVRKNLADAIRAYALKYYPDIDFRKLKIESERVLSKVTSLTCDSLSAFTLIGVLSCASELDKEQL